MLSTVLFAFSVVFVSVSLSTVLTVYLLTRPIQARVDRTSRILGRFERSLDEFVTKFDAQITTLRTDLYPRVEKLSAHVFATCNFQWSDNSRMPSCQELKGHTGAHTDGVSSIHNGTCQKTFRSDGMLWNCVLPPNHGDVACAATVRDPNYAPLWTAHNKTER